MAPGVPIRVFDTIIEDCVDAGFTYFGFGPDLGAFALDRVTIRRTGCDAMQVSASKIRGVGPNNVYDEGATNEILVSDISESGTWHDQGIPWELRRNGGGNQSMILVDDDSTLTLAAGVAINFSDIFHGIEAYGGLVIAGTAAAPVALGGGWGVTLETGSAAGSAIDYAHITGAGRGLTIGDSNPGVVVRGSLITGSTYYDLGYGCGSAPELIDTVVGTLPVDRCGL